VIEHDVADLKADLRLFRQEVTARFERLSAEMNQRFDTMHREMVAQTRWAIGLLALFIAVSVLF
jgi:hypothetical protein